MDNSEIEGSRQWYGAEEIGKLNDEIDRMRGGIKDLKLLLTEYEDIPNPWGGD